MKKLNAKPKFCPHCCSSDFKKKGYFHKKITNSYIPRYLCLSCSKNFSTRTNSQTYKQKRPDLNLMIFRMQTSGVTLRQTARNLNCSYSTVYKKLIWLSAQAQNFHNQQSFNIEEIQIDEMESIEHTKLKPVTIALAVSSDYKILSLKVGKIPAKGHLADIAFNKYGPRPNESKEVVTRLLEDIEALNKTKHFEIKTDEKPMYSTLIEKHFPYNKHTKFKAKDQIEKKREAKYTNLEKKIFDPLFALNQRCAKLRADIKRLTRRSWCTTKKIENLQRHLYLYIAHNNNYKFI